MDIQLLWSARQVLSELNDKKNVGRIITSY